MSENKVACSKCYSSDSMYWEKNGDEEILCENCNENLIARNLVNELMAVEVKIDKDFGEEEIKSDPVKSKKCEELESSLTEKDYESCESDSKESSEESITENKKRKIHKVEISDDEESDDYDQVVRRSVRATLNKYKHPDYEPPDFSVCNRRKMAFRKENVYKAPSATATCFTTMYVFNKGVYFQLGDIVAIVDSEGRGIFYAQITGFLTDTYNNKSATIQWLLPTKQSPPHNIAFDPRTYYLGYIEETPRSLDNMVPIMHAPSDYYRFNDHPFPPITSTSSKANYIWKNLGRVYMQPPSSCNL